MKIPIEIEVDVESVKSDLERRVNMAVQREVTHFFQEVLDGENNTRHEWYKSQAQDLYIGVVRDIAREYAENNREEIIDRTVKRLTMLVCNRKDFKESTESVFKAKPTKGEEK